MRKRYCLIVDTPELKRGALLEEACDDGTQSYVCINFDEYKVADDQDKCFYSRKTVENSPEWFVEVRNVWLTLKQYNKLLKLVK